MQVAPLSESALRLYAQKNKWWMSKARHGEAVHNKKWVPYINLERPKYEGSLWVADWSGTKLRYLASAGHIQSLYMLRIYDDATGQLMGYDLSGRLGRVARGCAQGRAHGHRPQWRLLCGGTADR